jgi:hypothetical protein
MLPKPNEKFARRLIYLSPASLNEFKTCSKVLGVNYSQLVRMAVHETAAKLEADADTGGYGARDMN